MMNYKIVSTPNPIIPYSNLPSIDALIRETKVCIAEGRIDEAPLQVNKYMKTEPTAILLPSEDHPQARFRPSAKFITYNGVLPDGTLKRESYKDGLTVLGPGRGILRNQKPLLFPLGHPQAGRIVRGTYVKASEHPDWENTCKERLREGKTVDGDEYWFKIEENGSEMLFNEYAAGVDYISSKYKTELGEPVEVTTKVQWGMADEPTYIIQLPKDLVYIVTSGGEKLTVEPDDYLAFSETKKGISHHMVNKFWFNQTYTDLETYQAESANPVEAASNRRIKLLGALSHAEASKRVEIREHAQYIKKIAHLEKGQIPSNLEEAKVYRQKLAASQNTINSLTDEIDWLKSVIGK
jgi:hypothetical protein